MQNTKIYQHKHIENLTCVILNETKKGYKVKMTQGKKEKIDYFFFLDFSKDKGLWKEKV